VEIFTSYKSVWSSLIVKAIQIFSPIQDLLKQFKRSQLKENTRIEKKEKKSSTTKPKRVPRQQPLLTSRVCLSFVSLVREMASTHFKTVLAGPSDSDKLHELCKLTYKEQAVWVRIFQKKDLFFVEF